MTNLLPAKMQATAKAWISLIGVVVAALVTAWSDVPRWVVIVGAVIASVGAYLVPNTPPVADKPESSTHPIDDGA